jgi:hypothetical protein
VAGIYFVEAADWLRAVGLTVVEVKGWQTRARSSGGFPFLPWGVVWHHTASQTTIENDTNWEYFGSDVSPIGNMTIARNGDIWLGAAGAANTQGRGGPATFSRGTVPLDGGNTRLWAIECSNNGTGEPWPRVQIDAYFAASNCLNDHFGNRPDDVITHAGWTTRKIDPAKASAVLGPWQPRPVNTSGTWNLDDVRAECLARAVVTPEPAPPEPEPEPEPVPPSTATKEDVMLIARDATTKKLWIGNLLEKVTYSDADAQYAVLMARQTGHPLNDAGTGKPVNAVAEVTDVSDRYIRMLGTAPS